MTPFKELKPDGEEEKPEPKPLGSQYPPPKGNQDTTEARKLMDGVIIGDKKDIPVIVNDEQIKKAQE